MPDVPIFINSRDRLEPLRDLVGWLESAGHDEIYIIDNGSAWPPLLEWYESIPHRVIMLGRNVGKNALWEADGVFDLTAGRPFAYTDSDIVPVPECPFDAVDRFLGLLGRYRGVNKAGFGIKSDDIPDRYAHKQHVLAGARNERAWPLERGVLFGAIDTQFAVYRPGGRARPHSAAVTCYPYVARHHSFYLDLDNLSEEDAFYERRSEEARAELGHFTHWATRDVSGVDMPPPPGPVTRLRWLLRGRRSVRLGL